MNLKKVYPLLGILFSLAIVIPNYNLHLPIAKQDSGVVSKNILSQLRYLDQVISNGGAGRMQRLFPEGAFFLYALHTLSWIQVAHRSKSDKRLFDEAVRHGQEGLAAMEKEIAAFPELAGLPLPNGAFFGGWLNWARGTYLALGFNDGYAKTLENALKIDCASIAAAYEKSSTPYLESYHGMAWPSDNIVVIASLRMHDFLYGERYSSVIKKWVVEVKKRLDDKTGMIPYQVDAGTGNCTDGAEANALAVILCYLAELDPEFAAQQYRLYCSQFPVDILGLNLLRHYPKGKKGFGNIDSGPVLFGIGSAATIVGSAPMRIFKDYERAYRIEHSIDALGFPITLGNTTRYAFGLMPIADAFLVWSKLSHVYTQQVPVIQESGHHRFWQWKFHLFSLFALIAVWFPYIWIFRKGRKK
jgi:hypothetical protein